VAQKQRNLLIFGHFFVNFAKFCDLWVTELRYIASGTLLTRFLGHPDQRIPDWGSHERRRRENGEFLTMLAHFGSFWLKNTENCLFSRIFV
jgi:hypothetical protein